MAKNEYVKKIKLDIDMDSFKKSKEEIDYQLENLDVYQAIKGNKKMEESLRTQLELKSKKEAIENALRELEQLGLKNSSEFFELKKESQKIEKQMGDNDLKTFKSVIATSSRKITALLASFVAAIGVAITSAIKELSNMTGYSSDGAFYSEDAYQQQIQYGLSDGENYALSQVKDKWNFSDDEFMMGGYNDERSKLLREQLELYKLQYNEMKASGYLDNIAQMRLQFQQYQEEFKRTIGDFFVENGDILMTVLQGSLDALGGILNILSSIFDFFGKGSQSSYVTDQNIQNIIDGNKLTSNNININNSMTSTSAGVTNVQQLKSVTADNYRQIIKGIGN